MKNLRLSSKLLETRRPITYDEAIRRLDERRAGMVGGASVDRDGTGGNGA
ncbi:MAG: hypothetical protein O7H41_08365 [Planctomycetota bacterium]|nr:hypothetical protein [Planctomycetota bacterium]